MKALFIGGHTDEELCFAGTIINFTEDGHDCECWVTETGTANYDEFLASNAKMGSYFNYLYLDSMKEYSRPQLLADELYKVKDKYDIVFTHSITDRHPLHRTVAEESLRIFNGNLLTYIGPWNGDEVSNYFVELSSEQIEKKIQALSCYKSQAHRPYMNPDFIRSWARYNGMKCGKTYAEGFRVQKLIR